MSPFATGVWDLFLVFVASLLAANGLVVAFGAFLVGLDRYGEARSAGRSGASYAALACAALIIAGLLAIVRG